MTAGGPLTVVLCSDHFLPHEGGAERQMRQVLAELARQGWRTRAVTRWAPGLSREEEVDGVRVLRVGDGAPGLRGALSYLTAGAARAAACEPDCVVSLQLGAALFAGALAARRVARPHVVRLAGGSPTGSELVTRGQGPLGWSRRQVLSHAAAVVSPAHHLLADRGSFRRAVDGRTRVVANGVAPAPVTPRSARRTVLWLGRPDPVKGLPDFVELARRIPEIPCVAAGVTDDGSLRAPANLRLVPRTSDPGGLVAEAAVLVSTSRFEGSSNAVLEALAARVPVVAFDVAGNRETADAAGEGVTLVPAGDLDALATAVRQVHACPDLPAPTVVSLEDAAQAWKELLLSTTSVSAAPSTAGA